MSNRTRGQFARSLLLLTLAGVLSVLLVSCSSGLTTEQKLEDFRYLFGILRDNHPYLALKARVESYDWVAHEKEFEDAVRVSRNDKDFAEAIQRMLLMINNGHTTIMSPQLFSMIKNLPPGMTPWLDEAAKTDLETVNRWYNYAMAPMQYTQGTVLPFRAWYCQGEYVVYWVEHDLASKYGVAPGQTIASIGGVPVHEFVSSLRGRTRLRFDPSRHRMFLPDFLPPYTGKPYRVGFKDASGKTADVELSFGKATGPLRSPQLPSNFGQSRPNLFTTLLADRKVAYLHISEMTAYEKSQGEALLLKDFFAKIKDTPALIIDVRGNGGGDDRFWMVNVVRPLLAWPITGSGGGVSRSGEYVKPFLAANNRVEAEIGGVTRKSSSLDKGSLDSVLTQEQVRNLPPEVLGEGFSDPLRTDTTILPSGECPYDGRVFLLVDRTVFSAAESFAQFCRSSGWATVVGECTGGDGGASTPAMVTLPNSKIPVFFPSEMGLNPDFTANEETHTMPDVVVEQSPEDLIKFVQAASGGKTFTEPDPAYDTALRECLRLALKEGR